MLDDKLKFLVGELRDTYIYRMPELGGKSIAHSKWWKHHRRMVKLSKLSIRLHCFILEGENQKVQTT